MGILRTDSPKPEAEAQVHAFADPFSNLTSQKSNVRSKWTECTEAWELFSQYFQEQEISVSLAWLGIPRKDKTGSFNNKPLWRYMNFMEGLEILQSRWCLRLIYEPSAKGKEFSVLTTTIKLLKRNKQTKNAILDQYTILFFLLSIELPNLEENLNFLLSYISWAWSQSS